MDLIAHETKTRHSDTFPTQKSGGDETSNFAHGAYGVAVHLLSMLLNLLYHDLIKTMKRSCHLFHSDGSNTHNLFFPKISAEYVD